MDLTTLALAKSYTDKKVEQNGGGSVELDPTLTKNGAAAQAAAVGVALAEKADKQNGIYYVEGTEASTVSDLRGINPEITELYEGLTIAYKMPIDFTSGPPVFLRINDLPKTQVYNVGTTYNFGPIAKGSIVIFVYTETSGLYYWHADWDKPQAQFGVTPSSEKRYLTATSNLGGGTTLLNTNDNCYMKDGELYSDNEKVGKHKNSVIYVVAGGSNTAWTATSDEINEYFDGLTIACRTTVGGGYPNTTLDINGLGGKQIRRAANASVTYDYQANQILHLTYTTINGIGYWCMTDLYYTNTDYRVNSVNNPNTKLFLVGVQKQTNSTLGASGCSNSGCYIGADNHLYSNGSKVPTYETGLLTLTTDALGDDAVLKGDFFRIDDMVTINFFISGTPVIAKPADSDLLDDESRKTAEIKFSGLPYAPIDDGRNWYAGGGHLQGYYPFYNQGGVAAQTTFTGWTMAASGDNAGVIFARSVTEGGYAAYALAVDQASGVKVYGAGTLTYRAQLPEVATIDFENEAVEEEE